MITFKEDTHQYFLGDTELISVTTLMQKHGLSPNYDGVPSEVLRAKAERGSMIHQEIEEYIKENKVGFTTELANFIKTPKGEVLASELILYNDIVAGTCDLILYENGEYVIADIKTTYSLHKDPVSWQLSIYANLFTHHNPSIKITKGQAYHFDKDGNLNVVEIPLKPVEEVERLLECERNGELYEQVLDLTDDNLDLVQLYEVEATIKRIEEQKKEAEEQAKELRAALMAAMEKAGVKKFENERIAITYIAPSTRTNVDGTKLKKELPEIYEQYTKTSNVKASLKITLKEDAVNE